MRWHVQRNSAEVITGTTTQIARTVVALNTLLQLITAVVVAIGLFGGLLIIDTSIALSAAALFGIAYLLLATTARRQLRSNGLKITEASKHQIKALQEGLEPFAMFCWMAVNPLISRSINKLIALSGNFRLKTLF